MECIPATQKIATLLLIGRTMNSSVGIQGYGEDDSSHHFCCACTLSSLGGSTSQDDDSCCSDGDDASVISSMSFFAEDNVESVNEGIDIHPSLTFISKDLSSRLCHENHMPYPLDCPTIVSSTCSSPINSPHSWDYGRDIFHLMADDDDESLPPIYHPPCQMMTGKKLERPPNHTPEEMEYALPDDIMLSVFSFLDVGSLKQMRVVNHRFYDMAGRNEAGWQQQCEQLWRRKAHVCVEAKRLVSLSHVHRAMDAYRISCQDGLFRHEITQEELCFDPITGQGTIWSFRFKKSAGPAWTSFDPWHEGLDARRMVFLADGTVKQFQPLESSSIDDGTAQNHRFQLLPAFSDRSQELFRDDSNRNFSRLEMHWRFITQPMDLPSRPIGAYIRLNVGGRDVPTYIVHRSPTMDWSFVLESLWAVYTSVPLPRRSNVWSCDVSMRDGERPHQQHHRPARMRLRRTSLGSRWLNVAGIESDSEDENDTTPKSLPNAPHSHPPSLLDDSVLSVTNRWQWREALLYNYGAITLPEGEGAEAEFDRVWNVSMRRNRDHIPNPVDAVWSDQSVFL